MVGVDGNGNGGGSGGSGGGGNGGGNGGGGGDSGASGAGGEHERDDAAAASRGARAAPAPVPTPARPVEEDGAAPIPVPFAAPGQGPESEDDDANVTERPEAAYVEHLRAFIAVDLPVAALRALAKGQAELRAAWEKAGGPRVRWVPVENVHVTLKFLGSVPAPVTEAVAEALDALAGGRRAPRVWVRGMGAFPSLGRPRVVWAGLDDQAGALAALADAVDARCEALGFRREKREYKPHVTLGRVKEDGGGGSRVALEEVISPLATRDFGEATVREVILYRSDLTPKGAHYTSLHRAPLGGARER
jgi:2'-5' RNA ligase